MTPVLITKEWLVIVSLLVCKRSYSSNNFASSMSKCKRKQKISWNSSSKEVCKVFFEEIFSSRKKVHFAEISKLDFVWKQTKRVVDFDALSKLYKREKVTPFWRKAVIFQIVSSISKITCKQAVV